MAGNINLSEEILQLARKLTPLQTKFVINLVGHDMSQREAYVAAGGKAKSDQAKDAAASRMLSDVKVKAFYDALIAEAAKEAVMTKQEAMMRLSHIGRANMHDIAIFKEVEIEAIDPKTGDESKEVTTIWSFKDSEDISPQAAASIKSVVMTKHGPKIEQHDPTTAIKALSDLLGWKKPTQHEVTGKDGQPIKAQADVSAPEIAAAVAGLMEHL